mgnify:CR=1 FL=1
MSYTNSDIESKARSMLGKTPDKENGLLRFVCEAAAAELESKLRHGVDREKIEELFVTAAGVLAISLYMELSPDGEDNVKSFKAGSLSVELGDVSSAAKLRRLAENMLCAYLDNGGFGFKGVDA